MPVRRATPEETEALFGEGMVFFGRRPAEPTSTVGGVPPEQDGTNPDARQDAHDRWLEAQTPEQLQRLASSLGGLARSKLGNVQTPSTPAESHGFAAAGAASTTDADVDPLADEEQQRGQCLTWVLRLADAEALLHTESEHDQTSGQSSPSTGSASEPRRSVPATSPGVRPSKAADNRRLITQAGSPALSMPLLISVLGPMLGIAGWVGEVSWLVWVGVAVCAINLLMDMASGAMKLPILPTVFMLVSAAASTPWWYGLGVGLILWTALEALGGVYVWLRSRRDTP